YRAALAELVRTRRVTLPDAPPGHVGLGDRPFADPIHLNGGGPAPPSAWPRRPLETPRWRRRRGGTLGPTPPNIFVSKFFFVFLPLVLFVYHVLLRGRTAKFRFLLAASWFFYAWWSAAYLWVIILTTVVDYYAGLLIEAAPDDRGKRRWLLMSIT